MPSRPPETEFYEDSINALLWRDQSRLFEDFCGPNESEWADREERFKTVLNDLLVRLSDKERP